MYTSILRKIAIVAMFIIGLPIAAQTTYITHEVQAGETLYSLSQKYGVSVNDIVASNTNIKDNTIMSGQSIRIPKKGNSVVAASASNASANTHTIIAGETLYGVSKKYNISVDQLIAANPGLTAENFQTGKTINIPSGKVAAVPVKPVTLAAAKPSNEVAVKPTANVSGQPKCKQMYLVDKKSTVYNICQQFSITEEELLSANPQIKKSKIKKGEYICIPYSKKELADIAAAEAAEAARKRAEEEAAKARAKQHERIDIAVILPFGLNQTKKSSEAVKMVDFYEGFLLSVEKMKQQGANITVHAYDEGKVGENRLDSILALPAMNNVQLVIGPMNLEHYNRLKTYCTSTGKMLVVPFSTKDYIPTGAPTVFQVNPPQPSIYNKVYEEFANMYSTSNIVIVDQADKSNKGDFIAGLKTYLSGKGITYKIVGIGSETFSQNLSTETPNVLIPTGGSSAAFEAFTNKVNDAVEKDSIPASLVTMFGYPEWQNLTGKNKDQLKKYQATFFTTFYTNTEDVNTRTFESNFRRWFKRDQLLSCPKFGAIGYDIGCFFISGMRKSGADFINNVSTYSNSEAALQNPLSFDRSSSANGYVNNAVMFVRYNLNGGTTVRNR